MCSAQATGPLSECKHGQSYSDEETLQEADLVLRVHTSGPVSKSHGKGHDSPDKRRRKQPGSSIRRPGVRRYVPWFLKPVTALLAIVCLGANF